MNKNYLLLYSFFALFICGCATYGPQFTSETPLDSSLSRKQKNQKTFYLIGDAGNANSNESTDALIALKKVIQANGTKNDYTIFLGDNVYDHGLPSEESADRNDAEFKLQAQFDAVNDFKGDVVFVPGNHDWRDGVEGLKRQQELIEEKLGNGVFQPKNGCPIKKIDVDDNIVLIAIDTQWYLENWDKQPTINDNCEIKTRNDFFLEIEGLFKKNNEKTIIVAMHHPMYTNGIHGGSFAANKHLFPFQSKVPLPIIGSLITQVRSQGGVSPQDRYHAKYSKFMNRLSTLARDTNKAIFVSGHEHSLQYIDHEGVKQIVSGAGSKASAASLGTDGLFSYGGQGFTALTVTEGGSSFVQYYSAKGGEPTLIFQTEVHPADTPYDTSNLSNRFDTTKDATVYNKTDTEKNKSYEKLWGDHYRYVYGTDIKVPVATLDTLMGGFTIERKGGGHQTRSLRLIDKDGRNFALRAVKKSAIQFLQSVAFKENFIRDEFKDSFTEKTLLDFYTSSHPFASLAIGPLSDAVDIYHTNPQLFYMPKHPALGKYNAEFGDELYIIEERPDDGFLNVPSFGNPDDIESTADLLKKMRKDEKYQVDEDAYVRARLFDMLLGDWDRHTDQWRWARFDESADKKVYRPIPRDRDQAFSNYDGKLLDFFKFISPPARQFQEYDGELKDIKWINSAGLKLDRDLTGKVGRDVWTKQAQYIQDNLTDAVIDEAFKSFPREVQDEVLESIKAKLKERRGNLEDIANRYYNYLSDLVVIKGTDKDDHFEITRGDGFTQVDISRIKNGKPLTPYESYTVSSADTDEVWIYGLDDDDTFHVSGKGKNPLSMRVIGGQNNDSYTIDDGRRLKIYEHKGKPNTIVKKKGIMRFSNDYSYNTHKFNKTIQRINNVIPSIGFNPDDGLRIGVQERYTVKGFKDVPFASRHILKVGYFTSTSGVDIEYEGIFTKAIGKWDLDIDARYTSESFSRNFFGIGNLTENIEANFDDNENFINNLGLDEDDLDLDFNRVRNRNIALSVGFIKDNRFGSVLSIKGIIEDIKVEDSNGRFIDSDVGLNPFSIDGQAPSQEVIDEIFEGQTFLGSEIGYSYANTDNSANPTRGMIFDLTIGGKLNLDDSDRAFGYLKPKLAFYNALTKNRKLVLKTQVQGQYNTGDILEDYEFYQGATLGANTGLRGFRNERFTGESSLVGSADLRYSFKRVRTGLLPLQFGVFGGSDAGRVWVSGEDTNKWHVDGGIGFWANAVDLISGQLGIFTGSDGLRFSFAFGLRL